MGSTVGLAEPFKSRVEQLLTRSGGSVGVISGFRTRQQQIALRRRNGCPDIYRSPPSACRVPTAIPGTSQHEHGLAVDFGGNLALAQSLAPQLGLKRTVPGEPWHFEPVEAKATSRVKAGITDIGADPRRDDDGPVDRFVDGLRRLTVIGLIVTGAATLVVMGGYRTVTGRSLVADTAKAAVKVGTAAATGGTSAAAGAAAPRTAAATGTGGTSLDAGTGATSAASTMKKGPK